MIALLSSDHYLTPLKRWREGAHFTHLARVDFAGDIVTAFVKIYPPGTGGVFGEALGYLACAELDVPRAPHAAVMRIPTSQLQGLNPPKWIDACGDSAWGWCCERIAGSTLEQFYRPTSVSDPAYAALLNCPAGSSIAAVDEILANSDRNDGSLIRLNSRSWAVIDHGDCLGSHCWPQTGPLDIGPSFLVRQAERLLATEKRQELQSRTIAAAHKLSAVFPEWRPLLEDLLHELQLNPSGRKVLAFLKSRTNQAWMPKRLGWLA